MKEALKTSKPISGCGKAVASGITEYFFRGLGISRHQIKMFEIQVPFREHILLELALASLYLLSKGCHYIYVYYPYGKCLLTFIGSFLSLRITR